MYIDAILTSLLKAIIERTMDAIQDDVKKYPKMSLKATTFQYEPGWGGGGCCKNVILSHLTWIKHRITKSLQQYTLKKDTVRDHHMGVDHFIAQSWMAGNSQDD